LIQDLGVSKTSENATDRLWMEEIGAELDNDYYDLCTGATCLAQILNVTSLPMAMMDYSDTGEDSDDSGGESDDSTRESHIPVRRTSRDPVLKMKVQILHRLINQIKISAKFSVSNLPRISS
jgi:hypothetical protein